MKGEPGGQGEALGTEPCSLGQVLMARPSQERRRVPDGGCCDLLGSPALIVWACLVTTEQLAPSGALGAIPGRPDGVGS